MINIFIDNYIFVVSLVVVSALAKLVVDVLIRNHGIADSTILVVPWIVVDGGVVLVSLVVGHLFLCQGKKVIIQAYATIYTW